MLRAITGVFAAGGLLLLGYVANNIFHGRGSVELLPPVNVDISYSDLVVIILTAVTVILAALGAVIAVLAFIGWRNIGRTVNEVSRKVIGEALKPEGKIINSVNAEVERVAERYIGHELRDGGRVTAIIEKQVESVAYFGVNQDMSELDRSDEDSES